MTVDRLTTPRTVRLVRVGNLGDDTRLVVIACHGYGMDVEGFARSFGALPEGVVLLCPEGLSRFYWGGFSGKPVASWMTKLERDAEIGDFTTWLDRVYVLAKAEAPHARIFGFGFSQGAATIVRWVHASHPAIEGIVLWSGTPPEDIVYDPKAYFERLRRIAYWGTEDELVGFERAAPRFAEVGLKFEHRTFRGGHTIDAPSFITLLAELLA